MKTADQMLAPVMKLAGERETGSGNNTSINKYWNAPGAPYCGYTVWYADKVSGGEQILAGCSNPASCRTFGEWLTAKGCRLTDNSKAQKGDIAFYCQYNEKEKRWMYQHVFFIFEKLSGTEFITLEGNTRCYATLEKAKASKVDTGEYEGIGYKKRSMPTSSVWQIFHPPYGATKNSQTVKSVPVSLPQIKHGCCSPSVRAAQILLIGNGYSCGSAGSDGDFGTGTLRAVRKFQKDKGLYQDGIVGHDTWCALLGV